MSTAPRCVLQINLTSAMANSQISTMVPALTFVSFVVTIQDVEDTV